jgi:hypothetical protein
VKVEEKEDKKKRVYKNSLGQSLPNKKGGLGRTGPRCSAQFVVATPRQKGGFLISFYQRMKKALFIRCFYLNRTTSSTEYLRVAERDRHQRGNKE